MNSSPIKRPRTQKCPIGANANRRSSAPKRIPAGSTRLDVVLALSIVAVNVIAFLPLLQQSREVARQTQCKQNLKQIGLALQSYHDTFRCFPSGFDVNSDGDYLGWGWNLKILPYLDSAPVYHQLESRLSDGFQGLPDTQVVKQRLPSLWCPSDSGTPTVRHALVCTSPVVDGVVTSGTADWQNRLGRSNYFGNAGYLQLQYGGVQYNSAAVPTSIEPLTNTASLGHFGNRTTTNHRYCDQAAYGGVFGQNSRVKTRDFTDGTANKFIVGERYSPADTSVTSVGHGTWLGVPDCTSAQGLAMALADTSIRMNVGLPLREQTTGFGSLHPNGAVFVFGDGSVRFIADWVDTLIVRRLSVINDSER